MNLETKNKLSCK